eukprot:10398986-Alexandrium_andersonii.AAC.1
MVWAGPRKEQEGGWRNTAATDARLTLDMQRKSSQNHGTFTQGHPQPKYTLGRKPRSLDAHLR